MPFTTRKSSIYVWISPRKVCSIKEEMDFSCPAKSCTVSLWNFQMGENVMESGSVAYSKENVKQSTSPGTFKQMKKLLQNNRLLKIRTRSLQLGVRPYSFIVFHLRITQQRAFLTRSVLVGAPNTVQDRFCYKAFRLSA